MFGPADTLSDCVRLFPAFGPYWKSEDNTFRDDDGSFTVCGVYLLLSWFVRERWQSFTEADWRAFAELASDHAKKVQNPDGDIGACPIEQLEGEAYSHLVAQYFERDLLKRYQFAG
jgi:hypothetical protein